MTLPSEKFKEIFDKEYPRDTFETDQEYHEYRRTAWMWFRFGLISQARQAAGAIGEDEDADWRLGVPRLLKKAR